MLGAFLRRVQHGMHRRDVLFATSLRSYKATRLASSSRLDSSIVDGITEAAVSSSSSSSSGSSSGSSSDSSSGSKSSLKKTISIDRETNTVYDAEVSDIVRLLKTMVDDKDRAIYIAQVLASKRGAGVVGVMELFRVGDLSRRNGDAGFKMFTVLNTAMGTMVAPEGQSLQDMLRVYLREQMSVGTDGSYPVLASINGTIDAFLASAQQLRLADNVAAYKRSMAHLEALLVVYTNMQQKYIKKKERSSKKLEREMARGGTVVHALAATKYNSDLFRECVLECTRSHSVLCAGQLSLFMIANRDYSMFEEGTGQNRAMYKLMAELSSDSMGVDKMLDMAAIVCEHRATALTWSFNFAQLNRFSNLMRQYKFFSAVKPTQTSFEVHRLMHNVKLKNAITSFFNAVKNGWFSFSICKFLTSITSATSSFEDLDWMITKVISNASAYNAEVVSKGGNDRAMIDIAQVFRSFDEGLAVAIDVENSRKDFKKDGNEFADATPAIMALLRTLVDSLKAVKDGPGGFVESQHRDLIGTYISLSFKLRHTKGLLTPGNALLYNKMVSTRQQSQGHAHVLQIQNRMTSLWYLGRSSEQRPLDGVLAESMAESLSVIDEGMRSDYDRLVAFYLDPYSSSMEYEPPPGCRRRMFRILCDRLRLVHRMKVNDRTRSAVIEVSKSSDEVSKSTVRPRPQSLEEIVLHDAKAVFIKDRVFHGEPYRWNDAVKPLLLEIVPKSQLPWLAMYATRNIRGRFPQSSWALQWLELVGESGAKLNKGLFKNALYTCEASSDIYGLFEVLYFAQAAYEDGKLVKFSSNNVNFGVDIKRDDFSDDIVDDNDELGLGSGEGCLPGQYWTKAFRIVWDIARYNNKDRLRQNPVVELMQIMYSSNVDLSGSTIRVLLQFLTSSITQSDDWKEATLSPDDSLTTETSLNKLTSKVYKDKRVDITHIECLCMSLLLRRKIKNDICHFRWKLSAAKPLYRSHDYLSFPLEEDLDGLSRGLLTVFEEIEMDAEVSSDITNAFGNINQTEGRSALYEVMNNLVSDGNSTTLLYYKASKESIFHVASCATFSAYLMGAREGQYRKAFDLLWRANALVDEYVRQKRSDDKFYTNSGST